MFDGSQLRMIGPYRVIDCIGTGGMGAVYRVVHRTTGQIAAAKVLSAPAVGRVALERFRNEARIHRTLTHPNIARVHEYLELDDAPCLIMDFVDGVTIEERLRRGGPFTLEEALRIFSALADAVSYVHQRGIVHRDLKANNVKLDSSGAVKLLDFGIATTLGSPRLTSTGNVVGTLQSLAPEQLLTGRAEPRSDVWALGIVFYEMLTGVPPFSANAPGPLSEKILQGRYVPPAQRRPELHAEVDRIMARCLRVLPEDRYASAEALLSDLRSLALSADGSEPLRGASGASPARLSTRGAVARVLARQRLPLLAAGAAALALAFLAWSLRTSPARASSADGEAPRRARAGQ